jgi:ABC-type branched-subunit amino acid transport system ATPase component
VTALELRGVAHGALRFAAGTFAPACTVVFGDDARALATFAAVTSGAVTPERGVVLLEGEPLATTPAARRRTASLLATETLPFARDLATAVKRVLTARGDARQPYDVLAPSGLDAWSRRAPGELDRDELRSVALLLALAHEEARVLLLYEPFATSISATCGLEAALEQAVARGTIVVLVGASRSGAARFGGPHCTVNAGVLSSVASEPTTTSDGATA